MISNAEIRARARAALGGKLFESQWLYPVLLVLVCTAISGALAFTFVGSIIAAGILSVATAGYFLAIVRNNAAHRDLGICVQVNKEDIGGNIITGLLYTVFITLWSMLFIIPGIIKSCSYAMTFYIKAERPELSATEAIDESRKMMNGHKMEYFLLQLSFIGWIIVGALCIGVGTLWVSAYMNTASAIFYEQIKPQVEIPELEVEAPADNTTERI